MVNMVKKPATFPITYFSRKFPEFLGNFFKGTNKFLSQTTHTGTAAWVVCCSGYDGCSDLSIMQHWPGTLSYS
jgi:hypothetical protein